MIDGPGGDRLGVTRVGSGDTVVVLLPQNRADACGWWPFASLLTDRGIGSVLVDFCGSGASACDPMKRFQGDRLAQATRAIDYTHTLRPRRVVVVGASFGGTVAAATALAPGVDAVVDISGQGEAGALHLDASLARATVPVLGMSSGGEPDVAAAIERAVAAAPARHKRFVLAEWGHGWDLVVEDGRLTREGEIVTRWIEGDYSG